MSDSAHPTLATFLVQRDQDASGISGTGVVAEGVQFSDGWVVTHWLDQAPMWEPKTDVWHHKGTQPITKVHGHGGATRIVWTADQAAATERLRADVVEAFDVPGRVAGPEAEREVLRRQIWRLLLEEWQTRGSTVGHPEEHCASFTTAVMPVVGRVLEQRDRVQATVVRARALADRWQAAHGSSMFLVRAAAAELRDVLDDSGAAPGEVVHSGVNGQASGLSGVHYVAAAECSAQHHGFPGDHRECIRAAQHRGDHIDEHGFHWSDTVAVYPTYDGPPCEAPARGHATAVASSCSNPDHACKVCGECVYEHPNEVGCGGFRTRAEGNLEELADAVRSVLGIDVWTVRADVNTWLLTACRQLEKSEDAREHLRGQRNAVAQALREVLATFHEVKDSRSGEVLAHEAPHVVHPSNFNRWRKVLAGLPENCKKPGGCRDCPHETEV
ncbi:hypothetical protein ABZU94_10640 [Streptomyces mirabilis]|uniref:hypothetical protein n=1 Tax=Streptomyces sp. NPDC005388 TaxID=3156717 RepID=UPI0033A5F542